MATTISNCDESSILGIGSVVVRSILGHLLHVHGNAEIPERNTWLQYCQHWSPIESAICGTVVVRLRVWLPERLVGIDSESSQGFHPKRSNHFV